MSRFLVIGECGEDRYVTCRADRLSPEGPFIVANPISTRSNPGMACNVTANLRSLGAEHVTQIVSKPNIVKTRFVEQNSGYNMFRLDEHDCVETRFTMSDLYAEFDRDTYSAIVVSSYKKGFLEAEDIGLIATAAKLRQIPVFVDHKFVMGQWSKDITFVKINRKEYDAQEAAGVVAEDWCENLIVTLGDEGSLWVNRDIRVPVEQTDVADLSGCGDSYLAGFVIAYTRNGGNVVTAMEYANDVARVAASKRGVVAVAAADVE